MSYIHSNIVVIIGKVKILKTLAELSTGNTKSLTVKLTSNKVYHGEVDISRQVSGVIFRKCQFFEVIFTRAKTL